MQNSQFPAGKHLDLSERLNRLFAGLHHLLGYHIATHCDIHSKQTTGGPSSSCIMIILRNKVHSEIIRVWRKYSRPLLWIKKYSQILNNNTSPYFYRASLVTWPLTMLKRSHFSELFISRFTTQEKNKAARSISERPIREAKNPCSKWPGGYKSSARFRDSLWQYRKQYY